MTVKFRGLGKLAGFSAQQMNKFKARGFIPNLPELDDRYVDILRLVKESLEGGYRLSVAFKEAKKQLGVDDKEVALNARFLSRDQLASLFNIDPKFTRQVSRGTREQFNYESARRIALSWVLHSSGVGQKDIQKFVDTYCTRGPIHGGNLITVMDGRVIENPFEPTDGRAACLVYAIVNIGATIKIIDDAFSVKERHHAVLVNSVSAVAMRSEL